MFIFRFVLILVLALDSFFDYENEDDEKDVGLNKRAPPGLPAGPGNFQRD